MKNQFSKAIENLVESRSALRVATVLFLYSNDISVSIGDKVISQERLTKLLRDDEVLVFDSLKNSSNIIKFEPLMGATFKAEFRESDEVRYFIEPVIRRISLYDSRITSLYEQFMNSYNECKNLNPQFVVKYEALFKV